MSKIRDLPEGICGLVRNGCMVCIQETQFHAQHPEGKTRGVPGEAGGAAPRATHPGKVDRLPKMLPVPGKSYPGDDAGREWRLRDGNRSGVSRHPRKVGVTRVTPGAFKMKLKR